MRKNDIFHAELNASRNIHTLKGIYQWIYYFNKIIRKIIPKVNK